jgi:translation elongation factor EF-4
MLARVKQGVMQRGETLTIKSTGKKYEIQDLGIMHPEFVSVASLHVGQVRSNTPSPLFPHPSLLTPKPSAPTNP